MSDLRTASWDRSLVGDIEVDVFELSSGCAEQCAHCSEAPEAGVVHARSDLLLRAVRAVSDLEDAADLSLFGNYWYPFPASEPFAHPELFSICQGIWRARKLPAYLLSLGWSERQAETAHRICENSDCIIRMGFTISNFSRLAQVNQEKHRVRLARCIREFAPLWGKCAVDNRPVVFFSPQFVENLSDNHLFSAGAAEDLLRDVCARAGLSFSDVLAEGRVYPRSVTGLGRAVSVLGVKSIREIPISAESPVPVLSRFPERSLSGLITLKGDLATLKAERGLLGRERSLWKREWELVGDKLEPISIGASHAQVSAASGIDQSTSLSQLDST